MDGQQHAHALQQNLKRHTVVQQLLLRAQAPGANRQMALLMALYFSS
jgi:hypothetical protein